MRFLCLLLTGLLLAPDARADSTWVYSVQLQAAVQMSPPQITLEWPPDTYGALAYIVSRKARDAAQWTYLATLPGDATSFTDTEVAPQAAYEYEVYKNASLGYIGTGYIYAGLEAPAQESRGKVVLIVATNSTQGLDLEIGRLESDLIGDGWHPIRHDVSSNQTPASVKELIVADYRANPAEVRAVYLLGHVPILFSGNLDWDTHGARPMPADGYYGDMDGDWSGSPDFFPSDVELMVGRVDLADMPGLLSAAPWPPENELLRNYLDKNHRWRHRQFTVRRKALMGNRRGDENGGAPAASGYRSFEPIVGNLNTLEANIQDNAPLAERWITELCADTWLWAYGCGGGQPFGISSLGTHGIYNDVYSTDLRDQHAKAVFVMLFGSWLGDWQRSDNILRAVLATPDYGLAACMAGRPHWFAHHCGLGEPLGFATRLSMNNDQLYRTQWNVLPRAVYVSLMGDPTLRCDVVAPPAGLTVSTNDSIALLSWNPSPDEVLGYYVYRAGSFEGPYTRLTPNPVTGTSFSDAPPEGVSFYQVRALKLESVPSGSYHNLSQAVFARLDAVGGPPPIASDLRVSAALTPAGLLLSWTSQPGKVYRVQGNTSPTGSGWVTLTGPLSSSTTHCTWLESSVALPQAFYRVLLEP